MKACMRCRVEERREFTILDLNENGWIPQCQKMISRRLLRNPILLSLTSSRFYSTSGSVLLKNPNNSPLGFFFFSSLTLGTFGLGVWQTYRYGWKLRALEQRAKHLTADPIDVTSGNGADLLKSFDGRASSTLGEGVTSESSSASSSSNGSAALNELQQVKVRGRFVEGKVALVGPRPPPQDLPSSLSSSASNSGVLVFRPFEREKGNGQVLILEGWSPRDKIGEIQADNLLNVGVQELSGVVRRGEKLNSFMSSSSSSSSSSVSPQSATTTSTPSISETSQFTFVDVDGIALALGLKISSDNRLDSSKSNDAAVIIELFREDDAVSNKSTGNGKDSKESSKHTKSFSFPIPRTLSSLRDGVHVPPSTHLIYAGTWFTLSLCGVALTAARFRGGRRSFRRLS